eukprot:TRINITY_DN631_c0_g1_i17.p2 TRINITY_DN631_c0_g1~~TRINITY_DN631_c0_g1_i17.p2  ORF type:complete len:109 (-),score=36.48 TRINITY_DN631_c0_g1_i17:126-452(-)
MKKEVVGGRLKLKRSAPMRKAIRKFKGTDSGLGSDLKEETVPLHMSVSESMHSQKTPAELRYEKTLKARLPKRIDETLKKTHREKIDEYNKKLAKLPEHFDIPRIGPG